MNIRSAKAKGRRCAQEFKDLILSVDSTHSDYPDLFQVTSSGVNGPDLLVLGNAKIKYPLAIECKNQEKINIWDAYQQAMSHQKDPQFSQLKPVLVFKRNRSKLMVCLSAEDFLCLLK